jgi:1D-myo-inositol-tetrakisphosphate 5-kinase/inositol-polyphosphate multikinase
LLRWAEHGWVLKPVQDGVRGQSELAFYARVAAAARERESNPEVLARNPDARDLAALSDLVPRFVGVARVQNTPQGDMDYLCLEDLTRSFVRPCIVDLKMGRFSHDPHTADVAKIERECAKFPPQAHLGFRLVGMKVWDREEGAYRVFGKKFGCRLRISDEEDASSAHRVTVSVDAALRTFFDTGRAPRHPLVAARCFEGVQRIANWFANQRSLHFYASSLLIMYEGATEADVIASLGPDADAALVARERAAYPRTQVHMIDFGHVHPTSAQYHSASLKSVAFDPGYQHGLSQLMLRLWDTVAEDALGPHGAPRASLSASTRPMPTRWAAH